MMKRSILLLSFLSVATTIWAQYGNQYQYNSFFKTSGAFEYPSELGEDFRTFSINLVGFNGYLGNSVADVNWLYNLGTNPNDYDGLTLAEEGLSHIINNTPETNFILGGAHIYPPLAFAYKFKKGEDKQEVVTLSLNHRVRVGSSFYFGKNFFRLLYEGNETFGSEPTNLTDFDIRMHAYGEWAIGAAFPVMELGNGIKLRGGFNMKYLFGYAALNVEKADLLMTTSPTGETWDFDVDYRFNAALPGVSDTSTGVFEGVGASYVTNGIGGGLGIDVGASARIMDNLKAYISVNDIGAITYSNDVVNYAATSTLSFDGVRVNLFNTDSNEIEVRYDTLLSRFTPKETNDAFKMALPTRLVLGGEFGVNGKETAKGQEYYQHNLYFTYIQGFNRSPGNATRPFINVGYGFNAKNMISVGVNGGYGGVYGANLGAFLGFRGGPFRLALGSNAILGSLNPSIAKGFDFTLNMGFAI